MTPDYFNAILAELIDENPLAVRAVLKILRVEFTGAVDTLAVTAEDKPRLLVNLDFLREHCETDYDVKAIICHEFLHVLLRHTEQRTPITPADHLATDAVINAIIHRTLGECYSAMMSRYYADVPLPWKLLRPPARLELYRMDAEASDVAMLRDTWDRLYQGQLCADDIREIVRDLEKAETEAAAADGGAGGRDLVIAPLTDGPPGGFLGNHEEEMAGVETASDANQLSPALRDALERGMRSMNGHGIWRGPRPGVGAIAYENRVQAASLDVERWKAETFRVLRKYLLPDPRSPRETVGEIETRLPVLNARDRRSFARVLFSPLLPDVCWATPQQSPAGRACVYLDVSGSMNAEMPLIITLLARLGGYIQRPFWAFSNEVAPAVIRERQLVARTTGGTSMSCVLEHVLRTTPRAAVVVTDGYIETLDPALVNEARRRTRLGAVVTRDGCTAALDRAGIPATQLARLPG